MKKIQYKCQRCGAIGWVEEDRLTPSVSPVFNLMVSRLLTLFMRLGKRPLNYAELSLLTGISRRQNAMQELATIESIYEHASPHNRKFLPGSIERLLTDWDRVLDTVEIKQDAVQNAILRMIQKI